MVAMERLWLGRAVRVTLQEITRLVEDRVRPLHWEQAAATETWSGLEGRWWPNPVLVWVNLHSIITGHGQLW